MIPAKRIRWIFYYAATGLFLAPFLLLWGEWGERSATTPGFLISSGVFLIIVLAGRWDITGYYLRPALLLAFLAICLHASGWAALLVASACFVLLWFLLARAGTKSFVELSFPLRSGWYCVAHGGASRIVNYHAPAKSQRFALDIVRLNALGFRARGIYPSRLESYAIFRDVLYSPCDGVVTAVVNDLSDLTPGEMDPIHVAGNHIIIQLADKDIFIGLAHLAKGSIRVNPGDIVTVGQPLAQIGNSGHTSEPHLHIHAKQGGKAGSMLDGEGVAIRFDGRWLIRNSVVRAASTKTENSQTRNVPLEIRGQGPPLREHAWFSEFSSMG